MNSGLAAINESIDFPVGQRLSNLVGHAMETIKRIVSLDAVLHLHRLDLRELVAAMNQRHGFAVLQCTHE